MIGYEVKVRPIDEFVYFPINQEKALLQLNRKEARSWPASRHGSQYDLGSPNGHASSQLFF